MQDANVDLWATDEVYFQQHGSRCRTWIPPEIKDPVLLHHAPTRKSVGYFGGVRLRDGRFVFRLENRQIQWAPASFSSSSNSAPPAAEPGDGLWSSPTMPVITTPACTDRGGNNTPITLLWISFPRTVPNSIRSSACGSSHAVVACTIATSTISKTSSARLNPSSQPGPLATMSSADYAQLLKTLCLVPPVSTSRLDHTDLTPRGPRRKSTAALLRQKLRSRVLTPTDRKGRTLAA